MAVVSSDVFVIRKLEVSVYPFDVLCQFCDVGSALK